MVDLSKLDFSLLRAFRAFEDEPEAPEDSGITVSIRFEGPVDAIEAAGFLVATSDAGEAFGVIRFKDIPKITDLSQVLSISAGSDRRKNLHEAMPDIRARASTAALADGLWHAVTATGAFTGGLDATGEGVIVAVIDTGIDYKHPAFMKQITPIFETRILRIWDMGLTPAAVADCPAVSLLESINTYGVEYDRTEIDTALNGGTAILHRDCDGHGTHCAGIAAGGTVFATNGNAALVGAAPKADIIAVKILDVPERINYFTGPANTEVFWRAKFRDAVRYCLRTAKGMVPPRPVVLSMSFGSVSAPGDALDEDAIWLDKVLNPATSADNNHAPTGAIAVRSSGNSADPNERQMARIVVPAVGSIVVPLELHDTRGTENYTRTNCVKHVYSPFVGCTFWYRRTVPFDAISFALRIPHQTGFSGDMPIGGNLWEGYVFRDGPPRVISVPVADNVHRMFVRHNGEARVTHPGGQSVHRHSVDFGVEPKKAGSDVTYLPGIYEMRITAPVGTEIFLACDFASWAPRKNVFWTVASADQGGMITSTDIHFEARQTAVDTLGRHAITVGAHDSREFTFDAGIGLFIGNPDLRHIAGFSSRGPLRNYATAASGLDVVAAKPDITAPGVEVVSADSFERPVPTPISPDWRSGVRFHRLSGTSMAAPVVAGVVALMLDKAPGLSTTDVRTHLHAAARAGVDPPTSPAVEEAYGEGMVDAFGAHGNVP